MKPFVIAVMMVFVAMGTDAEDWQGSVESHMGNDKASERETALCPDPLEIAPCVCSNYSVQSMAMDCSGVMDEDELGKVFSASFPVKTFRKLTIAHNPFLTVLPNGVFGDVSFIEINVYGGALLSVEEGAFTSSLNTAERIILQDNQLAEFPFHILSSFSSLTTLNLAQNNLEGLPDLTSDTLENLYVNNNPLMKVAVSTFKDTPAITVVYLQETGLQEIVSGTFSDLPNLKTVYLFGNSLTEVPAFAVEFLANKGTVNLNFNKITDVDTNAFPGLTGGKVEIQFNELAEFPEEVWLPLLKRGVIISASGNPLVCDYDIVWILKSPFFRQVEPVMTTCEEGQKLAWLNPADFDDCYE